MYKLMRSFTIVYISLLLATVAHGDPLPPAPIVPSSVSSNERAKLATRAEKLSIWRNQLQPKLNEYNRRCGNQTKENGTAEHSWCSQRLAELAPEKATFTQAIDKLASETDPNRREQIHAVINAMEQNKTEIKGGLEVANGMKTSNDIREAVRLLKSDSSQADKALSAAYMALQAALDHPKIQAAL